MTLPTIAGLGAVKSQATGTATLAKPAGWAIDDIFIAVVNSRGNPPWPGTGAAGWTQIASPSFGGDPHYLRVYWKRAVAAEPDPVPDADGNTIGRIIGIRGCIATGTPYEGMISGADTGADTAFTTGSGLTTLGPDRLVLTMAARDGDDAAARFSGEAQSGVVNLTEIFDVGHTGGVGGGIVAWTGEVASAGAVGALTATIGISARDARVMLALIPAVTGGGPGPRSQAVVIA